MKSRSSGPDLVLDVVLQGGDGCLVAGDQLGDDGGIGVDRARRGAEHRRAGSLVRARRDEVAIEDGLQRVADQGVAPSQDLEEAGAMRG